MSNKVWDEITYPFPNFNYATVEVWEWISNFAQRFMMDSYFSMLGLKLTHVSKRGHWSSAAMLLDTGVSS